MQRKIDWKSPQATAAIGAAVCGLLTHLYALANILHNYDNIHEQPQGYGTGIESGRWLLHILGDFIQSILGLGYNLSAVNGIAFIFLIAVSAFFLVDLLNIRHRLSAFLTGCLMVTFPTVAATMAFRFTAPYYGISMLLAVLAAWVVHRKWGIFLSALCIACSMGIYQAYAPLTITLFLMLLMQKSLAGEEKLSKLISQGVTYCICLILGVALYFLVQKIAITWYPLEGQRALNDYQGIDTMGQITLSQLPRLIKKAWLSGVLFPLQNYCTLAGSVVLKTTWILLMLLTAGLAVLLMYVRRRTPLNCAFFLLMLLFFPLAVNFIVVMAPEGIIYTIMVYPFVMFACLPLMLLEFLPKKRGKQLMIQGISLLISMIVFYNGYHSNLNYTRLYYANRQVENYFSAMVAQMRMTENYTPDKLVAVIGDTIEDPKLWNAWNTGPVYGGFAGSHAKGLLNVPYSTGLWFDYYMGYGIDRASQEELAALAENELVQQMPCWPSEGSLQVVDDYVVLKLEEIE